LAAVLTGQRYQSYQLSKRPPSVSSDRQFLGRRVRKHRLEHYQDGSGSVALVLAKHSGVGGHLDGCTVTRICNLHATTTPYRSPHDLLLQFCAAHLQSSYSSAVVLCVIFGLLLTLDDICPTIVLPIPVIAAFAVVIAASDSPYVPCRCWQLSIFSGR